MTRATITPAEFAALSKRKGHKYGARKTVYNGVTYDSNAEAKQAHELDVMKSAGIILNWERQVPVPLMVNDRHICTMIVDFRVTCTTGKQYFQECKGMRTPAFNLKMKLFKALFPNADFRVVKA